MRIWRVIRGENGIDGCEEWRSEEFHASRPDFESGEAIDPDNGHEFWVSVEEISVID